MRFRSFMPAVPKSTQVSCLTRPQGFDIKRATCGEGGQRGWQGGLTLIRSRTKRPFPFYLS
jgi:hypothetical protein